MSGTGSKSKQLLLGSRKRNSLPISLPLCCHTCCSWSVFFSLEETGCILKMFSPLTSSQDKHNPWMGNRAEVKETSPHHPHCSLSSHHLHRNTGRTFSSFTKDEAGNYQPWLGCCWKWDRAQALSDYGGPGPSRKQGSAEGREAEQGSGTNQDGLRDSLPPLSTTSTSSVPSDPTWTPPWSLLAGEKLEWGVSK